MNDIPNHTKETFERYFRHGFAPGGFGSAILANDLISAAAKADHNNKIFISEIALWVYHNAPYGSWGSYEAIEGWLDKNEHYENYQKTLVVKILSGEDNE